MKSAATSKHCALMFVWGLSFSLLACSTSQASLITFTATGVVDSVDAELLIPFAPGQTFIMNYSFESSTFARVGSDSQFAVYDALTSIDFTLGTYNGSAIGPEEIQVDNDPPNPSVDRYSVGPGAGSTLIGSDVNGLSLSDFFIRLDDVTNTAFSDALILPTSLSLSDFSSAGFAVFFSDGLGGTFGVTGTLTSVSVPEPNTFGLAGSSIFGFLALRRRFRVGNAPHQ